MIAATLQHALDEARLGKPWRAFVKQNPHLAPVLIAYLDGGPRPTDSELQYEHNHYATTLVDIEDVRRELSASVPPVPDVLSAMSAVIQVTGEVEPDGRIPTAAIRVP